MVKKRSRRHRAEEKEEIDEEWSFIHPDTTKSIIAIAFIALALILILSAFSQAGPAGAMIYYSLNFLFGVGYYLLPLIALIISLVLLTTGPKKIITRTLIGGSLFIIASLGLIDIILPEEGGLVGAGLGSIEILFGYAASLIISAALVLASFLLTVNIPLRLPYTTKVKESSTNNLTDKELKQIPEEEEDTETEEETEEEEKEDTEKETDLKIASRKSPISSIKKKVVFSNYNPPPTNLLKSAAEKATAGDLRGNANIIKRTFESFNIPVEMDEINIGPKVTRYTLKPAEGVKLSRITALHQDLALALAAHPIRIEAPIPGKSLVGIEVPNKTAAIVRLGNLINTPEFNNGEPLSTVIGRDVTGEPISLDIAKLPHLLIAGATGSGKSVALHSIIVSLLYKNSPEMLRLVFIDPKRVELSVYENIPHLVAPVVTQNKKAVGVFRWAINEMERRYEILQAVGARDIDSYNTKALKNKDMAKMSFLILVIDELADLMSTYGKEVEGYIVRLSQMARAVGIHLILATQRPSVEVITGLIKANITARMALKVASQIDSRTILDCSGAEKLLGHGDMLLTSPVYNRPKRIQGAFLTEDEIGNVATFIRENNQELTEEIAESEGQPKFEAKSEKSDTLSSPSIPHQDRDQLFESFANEENDDDMLNDAVAIVRQSQKASASLLQRRLKVGYARAARLLDMMEERGIVGPGSGAKPREVYLEAGSPDEDSFN